MTLLRVAVGTYDIGQKLIELQSLAVRTNLQTPNAQHKSPTVENENIFHSSFFNFRSFSIIHVDWPSTVRRLMVAIGTYEIGRRLKEERQSVAEKMQFYE